LLGKWSALIARKERGSALTSSLLEEEIDSWKGFPWALRKEDLELWNAMIGGVSEEFSEAVEKSGMDFATDAFFMALLLAQQKTIRWLQAELKSFGVENPASGAVNTTLDTC
jgi:hypothetical protein